MPAPEGHPHTTSVWTYVGVFVALLALTASTVLVTYVPLGGWHGPIGLLIAVAKATLILLFFMHGLESGRLVWLTLAAALFTLAVMMALTFSDYWSRDFDESIRRAVPRQEVRRPYP
jgi:cytochrome c oxidase subunit IV